MLAVFPLHKKKILQTMADLSAHFDHATQAAGISLKPRNRLVRNAGVTSPQASILVRDPGAVLFLCLMCGNLSEGDRRTFPRFLRNG